MGLLRKIISYPNLLLVARILYLQWFIGKRAANVFEILESVPVAKRAGMKMETIDRYVPAALRLGGAFGLLNTCLTRSVVRCILHRRGGVASRVAFGLRKDGSLLHGHCWLAGEEPCADAASTSFQNIVVYPAE